MLEKECDPGVSLKERHAAQVAAVSAVLRPEPGSADRNFWEEIEHCRARVRAEALNAGWFGI
jgi:hypothetical protein